jgi:hypothetical protein
MWVLFIRLLRIYTTFPYKPQGDEVYYELRNLIFINAISYHTSMQGNDRCCNFVVSKDKKISHEINQ